MPITSGGESIYGTVRFPVLSGECTREITHRYVVEREAARVLVGQSVRFEVEVEVEVDYAWLERTDTLVCVCHAARLCVVTCVHSNRGM